MENLCWLHFNKADWRFRAEAELIQEEKKKKGRTFRAMSPTGLTEEYRLRSEFQE